MSESGTKKKWECPHGCRVTNSPCAHLNRLIDEPPSNSVKAIPSSKIDRFYYDSGAGYILPKEIRDRTWEMKFRDKLVKSGLEASKVDILVCRFVYDMTISEIAAELNFVSETTVHRYLVESLKYLKKVGFEK